MHRRKTRKMRRASIASTLRACSVLNSPLFFQDFLVFGFFGAFFFLREMDFPYSKETGLLSAGRFRFFDPKDPAHFAKSGILISGEGSLRVRQEGTDKLT